MQLNLSKHSVTIIDSIVRYSRCRVPDALKKKDKITLNEFKSYFHTIDVINSSGSARLAGKECFSVSEYAIPNAFSGFVLPESVTLVNQAFYVDVLVRPNIKDREFANIEVMEPTKFNLYSALIADALGGGTGAISRTNVLLATAVESKFAVILGKGAVNYSEKDMPYVLKQEVGFFIDEKKFISGVQYADHIEKYLLTLYVK